MYHYFKTGHSIQLFTSRHTIKVGETRRVNNDLHVAYGEAV